MNMNRNENRTELLEELRTALEVVGARPERWSDTQRARLAAFVEYDTEAAQLFAEAKALDRVLDFAPSDGTAGSDLEARILAAATILPQQHSASVGIGAGATIIPLPSRRIVKERRWTWQSLTVLAASLVVGVVIGISGEVSSILSQPSVVASVDTDIDDSIAGALFDSGEGEQEQL
jgi:hypothetical protein